MGLQFNPFTSKLDFVGTGTGGSIGATGATGPAGVTGNQGSTGATGAIAPGGSVGAVDNAILRADVGTGIVQNSGLIIDDAIVSFAVTGDAGTDTITAIGHNFTTNQAVSFLSLTGGLGFNTNTPYFVRNISGNTFQLSTTSGGGVLNFATNITAGSIVAIQPNVAILQNTTETGSSIVLTPKGTGAFILGPKPDGTAVGGNARGAWAVDLQITRTAATQVASGNWSVVWGQDCTATGSYTFAGGLGCTATGGRAFCASGHSNVASGDSSFVGGGRDQVASGEGSVVVGGSGGGASLGNTASGIATGILSGRRSLADRFCMQTHAAGQFASQGDAQRARFVLRCKTTTNSAVEMALDGGTIYLGIPSGKVIAMTINISGVKSDGSAVAHYIRQYAVKNVTGTSSQVYAPVTIGTDNAAGTSIALSANDADDTLRIAVTGILNETWRWVASVDAVEIGYGT